MNTALLVLRIIPGLLLMGHGLQKLVPPGYSPPLLHAAGHRGTGAGFESLGIRPAVMAAVLAGSAELVAGFSLAAGLLTPVGTVLVGAVMITAILKVHVSNGIWAAEGGFEFPLVLLTVGFAITALGPGCLSVDSWLGIDNWAGINWTINPAARSAIALAVGLAGGLVVAVASHPGRRSAPRPTRARRRRADALRVGGHGRTVIRRVERRRCTGIRRGKAGREAHGSSPSGCCAGLLALAPADDRGHSCDSSRRRPRRDGRRRYAAPIDSA